MVSPTQSTVETPTRAFYREAMESLNRAGVPFLVGGSFAFLHQSGIDRSTKDLDLFVRPEHVHKLLEAMSAAGYDRRPGAFALARQDQVARTPSST